MLYKYSVRAFFRFHETEKRSKTGFGLFNDEIVSLTPAGSYCTENRLSGGNDGGQPHARRAPADGRFTRYFGTNNVRGAGGTGTVFRLDMM